MTFQKIPAEVRGNNLAATTWKSDNMLPLPAFIQNSVLAMCTEIHYDIDI